MGSMREKQPGVWELRVFAHGKATSRTFRGSKRDATSELVLLEARAVKGEFAEPSADPDDPLLSAWLTQWWDRESPNWSPTSAATARSHIANHIRPALGNRRLTEVTVRAVEEWTADLRDKGLAAGTQLRILGILHQALEQAERWELIARNPVSRARKPKVRYAEPVTPTAEDFVRALTHAPTIHHRTLIMLAAATGGRRGQLVALRWSDIDLEAGELAFHRAAIKVDGGTELKEPKGGKPIRVALDPITVAALKAYRSHRRQEALTAGAGRLGVRTFVFASDARGRHHWYPDTATKAWAAVRDLREDTGDPKRPGPLLMPTLQGARLHDLRHAHATWLMAGGVDRKTVADRLGHAQLSTTDRYTHAVDGTSRTAADVWGRIVATAAGDQAGELAEVLGFDRSGLEEVLGRTAEP